MSEDLQENISMMFQKLLPLISSIILLLISYVPMDFMLSSIKRYVSIACVYFWIMHRPDLFNLTSIFVLAMVEGVLSLAPFGSSLFALLLTYVLVTNLTKFLNAKPFVVIWYGFGVVLLAVLWARWLLVSVYYGQFLPATSLFFSFLITFASYPIFSLVNVFIQNNLIRDEV